MGSGIPLQHTKPVTAGDTSIDSRAGDTDGDRHGHPKSFVSVNYPLGTCCMPGTDLHTRSPPSLTPTLREKILLYSLFSRWRLRTRLRPLSR